MIQWKITNRYHHTIYNKINNSSKRNMSSNLRSICAWFWHFRKIQVLCFWKIPLFSYLVIYNNIVKFTVLVIYAWKNNFWVVGINYISLETIKIWNTVKYILRKKGFNTYTLQELKKPRRTGRGQRPETRKNELQLYKKPHYVM